MSPKSLFAVAIGAVGVWFIASCVVSLIGSLIGPFASLLVGLVLLLIAYTMYRGD
jgi:hypothetical protein